MFAADFAQKFFEDNRGFFRDLAPRMAEILPNGGPPILDLGESLAFFAGDGSPVTQAGGLLSPEHLARIDAFYAGRATSWEAVLSCYSDAKGVDSLFAKGATMMNWENIQFRRLGDPVPSVDLPAEMEILEIGPDQLDEWSLAMTAGFEQDHEPDTEDALLKIMRSNPATRRYMARWNGQCVGTAQMTARKSIVSFGGASTLPAFRGRGIQSALIQRRLRDAQGLGEFAMIGGIPTSSSHRNAERAGFRIGVTLISLSVPVSA